MKVANINVEYLDHMGSDLSVVNAARVSFDKFHEVWEPGKDEKLIQYLARHNHWTPFAHTALSLRIKAPIFVARQLVKHQVGLVWNEVSRRYVDSEVEFYIPKEWHQRPDASIKQGSGEKHPDSSWLSGYVREITQYQIHEYYDLLDRGVTPEEARIVLPLNTMTEWIWTGNAASWSRVCNLRMDGNSQKMGTQEVAEMIYPILKEYFPVSTEALVNGEPRK